MIDKKEIQRQRNQIHRHNYAMPEYPPTLKYIIGWVHDVMEFGGNPDTAVARQGILDNLAASIEGQNRKITCQPMRIGKDELFLLDSSDLDDPDKQARADGLVALKSFNARKKRSRHDDIPEDADFYPCKCGLGGLWVTVNGGEIKVYVDHEHDTRGVWIDGILIPF